MTALNDFFAVCIIEKVYLFTPDVLLLSARNCNVVEVYCALSFFFVDFAVQKNLFHKQFLAISLQLPVEIYEENDRTESNIRRD